MTDFYILYYGEETPLVAHTDFDAANLLRTVWRSGEASTTRRKFPPNNIELEVTTEFVKDYESGELGCYIQFRAKPDQLSYIAMHEAGHFLASYLFYEKERDSLGVAPPKWVTCLPYMIADPFRPSLLQGCSYSSECRFSFVSPEDEMQMLQHTVQSWGGEVAEELIYGSIVGNGSHLNGDRMDRENILRCLERDRPRKSGDRFLKTARRHAQRLLSDNLELLETVANRLNNEFVLTAKDVREMR